MLESFEPLRTRVFGIEPEPVQLPRRGGSTRADVDATVAEAVEHPGALGDPHRVVVRGRREREAEPEADVFGLDGGGTEDDLRRRHVREPAEEVVLGEPHLVPAVAVGMHDLLDRLPDDGGLQIELVERHVHLVEQAELHRCVPLEHVGIAS